MAIPKLGRVQLRIMNVLWQRGRLTAREITDALNAKEPISHSTVQTLLRQLEAKGAVGHEVDDRTFLFHPKVNRDALTNAATRDLVSRFFEGSVAGLVAQLVKTTRLSRQELAQIKKLIKEDRK